MKSHRVFAVVDQGVVSLGNFATNLAIIRGLAPGDFGIYAALWSLMLLLNTLQSSLIVHPMLVIGASAPGERARKCFAAGLGATTALMIPLAAIAVIAAAVLHAVHLAAWIVPALLAWQLQEGTRRALTSQERYGDCLFGDSVSYLGQAALVFLLASAGMLSLPAVFACMMGTSLLAGLIQTCQIRPAAISAGEFADSIREFWKIGHWIANLNIVATVTTVAMPWYLTLLRGPVAAAGFQALLYVTGMVQPLVTGIGSLVAVSTARATAAGTIRASLREISRPVLLGAGAISVYGIFLSLFPSAVFTLLFRSRSPYAGLAPLLPIFAVAGLLLYLSQMLAEALVGMRATRSAFLCQLSASLACAATAIVLVPVKPAWGAGMALIAASLTRLIVGAILLPRVVGPTESRRPIEKPVTADELAL